MTTPAMDSTGVIAESSRSAEIICTCGDCTSDLPEISKPNSESLPPYFRSYEAYMEHCMAKFGPEGVPLTAFDSLCASCTAAFKAIAELRAGGYKLMIQVPFCSVNEFLRSAAEGNCHVCYCFMAGILRTDKPGKNHILRIASGESGVDAPGRGYAAFMLNIEVVSPSDPDWLDLVILEGDQKKSYLDVTCYVELTDGNYRRARGFPTTLNIASDASWNQALKWIKNCHSHPLCNAVQATNLQDKKRPARLVAVGVTGDTHVRICETSQDGFAKEPYMTLSHCWGKNGVPIRLLEENYARFLDGIQLSELPNTFRDAIELTRKLEIPFIWIDSLCIIQNSPGNEDWIQESAKMQQVYRNSFLNLAAGASADSNGGLLYRRDPLLLVPWSIRLAENCYLTRHYTSEYTTRSKEPGLVLYTRGWVLQEQLLARRTLVFGQKELYWECSTCQASESFPDSDEISMRKDKLRIFRPDWENLLKGEVVDSDRRKAWNLLIRTYSYRSLTKPSDRLVAISGLAEQLSSRWSGITYLAGLWSYRLIEQLLWRGLGSQRNTEIAPSWSWASLIEKGSLTPGDASGVVDVLAEVLEAKVTPKARTSPFGPVACGGSIRLRSPVIRARITIKDKPKQRSRYNLALEDSCNLDALLLKAITVFWDDVNDVKADVKDAYLVPILIGPAPTRMGMNTNIVELHGLVLLKTEVHSSSCKTQFRRAGLFWDFDDGSFIISGNDSDNGSDDDLDDSIHSGMDDDSGDISLKNRDKSSDEYRRLWRKRNFRMLTKKGLFRDIDSWLAERLGKGPEERINYLKRDPYVNGPPLITALEHRYNPEAERVSLVFPKISSFLDAIAQVAQNNKANGTPDPVLGMGEGNGYYTYEIV